VTSSDLRAARKRLGFTQAQLAAALDVTRDCIARYEGGTRAVPRMVDLAMRALSQDAEAHQVQVRVDLAPSA